MKNLIKFYSGLFCLLLIWNLASAQPVYDNEPSWQSSDTLFTMNIAVGLLDNNNTLDIVAANYKYPYTIGTITSGNASDLDTADLGGILVVYWNNSTSYSVIDNIKRGYEKVLIADLDNDGDQDIVVGCVNLKGNDGANYYYINLGSGSFNRNSFSDDPKQDTHDIAVGDINNDGRMDILTVGVYGSVYCWLQNGSPGDSSLDMSQSSAPIMKFEEFDLDSLDEEIPGSVIELGDMDQDGDLDLFVDFTGDPSVYFNSGPGSYFDSDDKWSASHIEHIGCASFGWVNYSGTRYLGLAIGSNIHLSRIRDDHERRGNNIYILSGDSLLEVFRGDSVSGGNYQLVYDIQWGDLNADGDQELVTGAYPTLDIVSRELVWIDGHEQYYDLTNSSLPTFVDTTANASDWNSDSSDLTTSIALGDIDGDSLKYEYFTIDSADWSTRKLYYFDYFPFNKIQSVNYYIEGVAQELDTPPEYCYDPRNGWVSFEDDESDFDSVKIGYWYSTGLDLVVGNDGYNYYYEYGAATGSCSSHDPYSATIPNESTIDYEYDSFSPVSGSQMDTEGAIGFSSGQHESVSSVVSRIENAPDMNLMVYWFRWNDVESIRGHYFWNIIDQNVDAGIDANMNVILLADGSGEVFWTYPQTARTADIHPIDERYGSFFARNMVNRYRDGGILDSLGTGISWGDDEGVWIYAFEGEPEQYGTIAYKTDIQALRDKLKYNYGMVKAINDTFLVISPNFHNDLLPSSIDTAYYNSLYSAPDYALKKFVDVVNQQFYSYFAYNDAEDPARNDVTENICDVLTNLMTTHGDSGKPIMSLEWHYDDDDDATEAEKANWSVTQIAEMFSCNRFKWVLNWYAGEDNDMGSAINQQAKLLNGSHFYNPATGSNPDTTAFTGFNTFDYTFENQGDNSFVHFVRTDTLFLDEGDTLRLNLVTDPDSIDDNNVSLEYLNFSNYERPCYEDANGDSAWVTFLPFELDTTPVYVIEDFTDADSAGLTLNFPRQEWMLVSLNVDPGSELIPNIFSTTTVPTDTLNIFDYRTRKGERNGGTWTWFPQTGFDWSMVQGYKIWTYDVTALEVRDEGWIDYNTEIDITPYDDSGNYNFYIAYPPYWDMPCSTAFKELFEWGVGSDTVLVWAANSDGLVYFPDLNPEEGWEVFRMRQGEGYYLRLTDDSTLNNFQFATDSVSLESVKDFSSGDEKGIASLTESHFQFRKRTQDLYPIVLTEIEIQGVTIADEDEIGVFMWDSVCVGAKKLNGNNNCIITAWKDEIMTPDIVDGYINGAIMSFKYWDASAGLEYNLNVAYTINSLPPVEKVYYTTNPIFGQKDYALLSFGATTNIDIPETYSLHQNYPNPFNPTTTIKFDMPYLSKVKLEIFNILGQRVAVLLDGNYTAGYKNVRWHASELSSGIYIYRIKAESLDGAKKFASVKKMVLIK